MLTANTITTSRPMSEKDRIIARLQEKINRMAWNSKMGCHTRAGIEVVVWPEKQAVVRHAIFFDVDGVHPINQAAGTYAVYDGMMHQIFSMIRSTDVIAGQWQSGDEFLILMIETADNNRRHQLDPEGLVQRLREELAKQGLTALFAWGPIRSTDLDENIQPLADRVLEMKRERGKAGR